VAADIGGDDGIHSPGEILRTIRAKFTASHEDDILDLRKLLDRVQVKKVTLDGLDAPVIQNLLAAFLAEASDPVDRLLDARLLCGQNRHASQGHAHLTGNPQNHHIAVQAFHHLNQCT
jgi:hypothetical protein